jgi:hypothetical protein
MSVAPELPPVVFIPERARTTRPTASPRSDRPWLQLVPDCHVVAPERVIDTGAPVGALIGPQSADRSALAPMRLTRRGTVVASLAVGLLGGVMLVVAYLSLPAATERAVPAAVPNSVVTVQSGDTLWSIAQSVAPNRDPRAVVADLQSRNHLSDVALSPGQTLKVG